jgi:hypothetical protein
MAKRYIVDLTQDEKKALIELTRKGKPGTRKVKRANILLMADQGKSEQEIITALHTCRNTVLRTRCKFVNGGLDGALNELPRQGAGPRSMTKSRPS